MSNGTTRQGQQYRPDTDVVIPYLQHMGDIADVATYYGDPAVDIQPNDRQSAVVKVVDRDAVRAALFGIFMSQPTTISFQLPPILAGFTVTVDKATGSGSSFLDGTGEALGTSVSLSLPIKSDATASATITPDVLPNTYEPWTQDLFATEALMYADDNTTRDEILVRLTTGLVTGVTVTVSIASPGIVTYNSNPMVNGDVVMFTTTGALPTGLLPNTFYYVVNRAANSFRLALTAGGTAINTSGTQSGVHTIYMAVRPWPVFKPEPVIFVVFGQAVNLSANAQVQQQLYISGANISRTTGFGTGTSRQFSSNVKTVRVSPTLHGPLSLLFGTGFSTDTETASVSAHAQMAVGTNWIAMDEDTGTITQDVTATIMPNSFTATTPSAYPTHGLYLFRLDVGSFEYGTSRIRAIVFDFATLA